MNETRRLAAILVADVACFSRLIANDDLGTPVAIVTDVKIWSLDSRATNDDMRGIPVWRVSIRSKPCSKAAAADLAGVSPPPVVPSCFSSGAAPSPAIRPA